MIYSRAVTGGDRIVPRLWVLSFGATLLVGAGAWADVPRLTEAKIEPLSQGVADLLDRVHGEVQGLFCGEGPSRSCSAEVRDDCDGRIAPSAATLASFVDSERGARPATCSALLTQSLASDLDTDRLLAKDCAAARKVLDALKKPCGDLKVPASLPVADGEDETHARQDAQYAIKEAQNELASDEDDWKSQCAATAQLDPSDVDLDELESMMAADTSRCPFYEGSGGEEAEAAGGESADDLGSEMKGSAEEEDESEALENESSPSLAGSVAGAILGGPAALGNALLQSVTTYMIEQAAAEAEELALAELATGLCDAGRPVAPGDAPLFPSMCDLAAESGVTPLSAPAFHDALVADLQELPGSLSGRVYALDAATHPDKDAMACGLMLSQAVFNATRRGASPLPLVVGAVDALRDAGNRPAGTSLPTTQIPWASCQAALAGARPIDGLSREAGADAVELAADALAGGEDLLSTPSSGSALIQTVDPALHMNDTGDYDARVPAIAIAPEIDQALLQVASPAVALQQSEDQYQSATPDHQPQAATQVLSAELGLVSASVDAMLALETGQSDAEPQTLTANRDALEKAFSASEALYAGRYEQGLTLLLSHRVVPIEVEPFATLVRDSGEVCGVASAQSSDQVQQALTQDSASRADYLTRRRRATWGLSAQVGAVAGVERILGLNPDGSTLPQADGFLLGVRMPIGLDASVPLGSGALGAMLQVFDLGGVASARLSGNAGGAQVEPKLGFVQVLEPGLSIYYGLGKSPIVLALSAAFAPAARPVEVGAGQSAVTVDHNVVRVGIDLAFDVPVFMW
jgi:hypothetical protein